MAGNALAAYTGGPEFRVPELMYSWIEQPTCTIPVSALWGDTMEAEKEEPQRLTLHSCAARDFVSSEVKEDQQLKSSDFHMNL